MATGRWQWLWATVWMRRSDADISGGWRSFWTSVWTYNQDDYTYPSPPSNDEQVQPAPLTHVGEKVQAILSAAAPPQASSTETLQLLRQLEARELPPEPEVRQWERSEQTMLALDDGMRLESEALSRSARTACFDTDSVPSRWTSDKICQRCRLLYQLRQAANAGSSLDQGLVVIALHTTDCVSHNGRGNVPSLPVELMDMIFDADVDYHDEASCETDGQDPVRITSFADLMSKSKRYAVPPAHSATEELCCSLRGKLEQWSDANDDALTQADVDELVLHAPRILAYRVDGGLINELYVERLGVEPDYEYSAELSEVLIEWADQWKDKPIVARLTSRGFVKDAASSRNDDGAVASKPSKSAFQSLPSSIMATGRWQWLWRNDRNYGRSQSKWTSVWTYDRGDVSATVDDEEFSSSSSASSSSSSPSLDEDQVQPAPLTHVGEKVQAILSAAAPPQASSAETLQLLRQLEARELPSKPQVRRWKRGRETMLALDEGMRLERRPLRRNPRTACFDTASVPCRWTSGSICQRCRLLYQLQQAANAGSSLDQGLLAIALHTTDCVSHNGQGTVPSLPIELVEMILDVSLFYHGGAPRKSTGGGAPQIRSLAQILNRTKRYAAPPAHPTTEELCRSLRAMLDQWSDANDDVLTQAGVDELVPHAPRILAYRVDGGLIDNTYLSRLYAKPRYSLRDYLPAIELIEWADQWKDKPIVALLTPRGFMKDAASSSSNDDGAVASGPLADESTSSGRPKRACRK